MRRRRSIRFLLASATVLALASASPDATPATASPAGSFRPSSATFVSERLGWALGRVRCGKMDCPAVLRTRDGGRTWQRAPAPRVNAAAGAAGGASGIRFATPRDGWAFGGGLWSTHDGGRHWRSLGPSTGLIADLAAGGGRVYAIEESCNTAGGMCQLGRVLESPVSRDAFRPVRGLPRLGNPGGYLAAALALHGAAAYVVTLTTAGGVRLYGTTGGAWSRLTPPCTNGIPNAIALPLVATYSTTGLMAVCPGEPSAGSQLKEAYRSTDGGRTWTRLADPPATPGYAASLAAVDARTAFLATARGTIDATRDGGRTWRELAVPADGADGWGYVGFTTSRQGFALPAFDTPGIVAFTRDGGRSWSLQRFS